MPNKPPTHKPARLKLSDGRPSASARGYDAHWKNLRRVILAERPVCEQCEREASAHVDHKDGDVRNLDEGNFQALCHSCHSRKTVACDGGFGRQRKRGQR